MEKLKNFSMDMALMMPEPFGGLIILIGITVALIVGLVVAIAGRKSKRAIGIGIAIIGSPWILLFLLAMASPRDIDEWNPTISLDSEVLGEWKTDDFSIILEADTGFLATIGNLPQKGTWRRDDWNLYLTDSDGSERYMRFVEDSGELLLLPTPPEGDDFNPGPIARRTNVTK